MTRNAVFFFATFLLAALLSFWPTYFTRMDKMASWHVHVHGVFLFAWLLLLIAQAWLIRNRRGPLHRALGKVSYVLAPLVVVSALVVEHRVLVKAAGQYNAEALYFAYVILALLVMFTASYVLAMVNRRTPALHMRYMICTALTLVDPVFARILGVHAGIDFGPGQMITYGLVDAFLLWLAYNDRATPYRVFHKMLAVFLVLQLPTFFLYKTAWWPGFVARWAALPMS